MPLPPEEAYLAGVYHIQQGANPARYLASGDQGPYGDHLVNTNPDRGLLDQSIQWNIFPTTDGFVIQNAGTGKYLFVVNNKTCLLNGDGLALEPANMVRSHKHDEPRNKFRIIKAESTGLQGGLYLLEGKTTPGKYLCASANAVDQGGVSAGPLLKRGGTWLGTWLITPVAGKEKVPYFYFTHTTTAQLDADWGI